jgi:hypothetical protein
MSKSLHTAFAADAHLVEGQFLREAQTGSTVIQFSSFIYVLDNSQIRPITAKH